MMRRFEGIILAAGFSERMNNWKPELKIDKLPIIVHSIRSMVKFCEKIFIVGGFNYKNLNTLLKEEEYFSYSENDKLIILENEKYNEGMFSSVKVGLKNISPQADGIFILPGDMPFVLNKTFHKLIEQFSKNNVADVFIPVTKIKLPSLFKDEFNKKGHPVLIRSRIVKQILNDENENIFRDVIKKFEVELCPVDDKGIIIDIDDKKDLEKAKIYFDEFFIQQ